VLGSLGDFRYFLDDFETASAAIRTENVHESLFVSTTLESTSRFDAG
jgi:hypothetical protein